MRYPPGREGAIHWGAVGGRAAMQFLEVLVHAGIAFAIHREGSLQGHAKARNWKGERGRQ